MNKNNPEEQPLMLSRRAVLRTAAVLGMSAVLAGCTSERLSGEKTRDPSVETIAPTAEPAPTAPPSAPTVEIAAASPRTLHIPSLNLEVNVAGAIHPVPVARRGDGVYYDPPTLHDAYWAEGSALPASPSEGTTYLFGHSDTARSMGGLVFDRLPELMTDDKIELKTALGRFAYRVTNNLTVPYDDLSRHTENGDFGDGSVKDRLVLITCRVPDQVVAYGNNTVIVAEQESAALL